jgi:hypothetical protein
VKRVTDVDAYGACGLSQACVTNYGCKQPVAPPWLASLCPALRAAIIAPSHRANGPTETLKSASPQVNFWRDPRPSCERETAGSMRSGPSERFFVTSQQGGTFGGPNLSPAYADGAVPHQPRAQRHRRRSRVPADQPPRAARCSRPHGTRRCCDREARRGRCRFAHARALRTLAACWLCHCSCRRRCRLSLNHGSDRPRELEHRSRVQPAQRQVEEAREREARTLRYQSRLSEDWQLEFRCLFYPLRH